MFPPSKPRLSVVRDLRAFLMLERALTVRSRIFQSSEVEELCGLTENNSNARICSCFVLLAVDKLEGNIGSSV